MIEEQIKELEEQIAYLHKRIEPLQQDILKKHKRVERLREKLSAQHEKEGKLDDIRWLIENYEPDRTSQKHYQALSNWAYTHGVYMSGYIPETNQPSFKVMMRKDGSNLDQTIDTLNILLPILKPFRPEYYEGDGEVIYISVFEHTLSEWGSYGMYVDPNGEWAKVDRICRYRGEVLFSGTIREALEYLAKNHWYE